MTITADNTVAIVFSREVAEETEPLGHIGMDVNERNVTIAASNGHLKQFKELEEVAELKERYREIRAEITRKTGQDRRISQREALGEVWEERGEQDMG